MDFAVALSPNTPADEGFELDDIRLVVEWLPQPKDRLYYTGMGVLGASFDRDTSIPWKWSTTYRNNFMWAGKGKKEEKGGETDREKRQMRRKEKKATKVHGTSLCTLYAFHVLT